MRWLARSQGPLAGILAVALLSSCATLRDQVKPPEVSVGDLRVVGMSLADAQIAVELAVKNPNGFGVSINGLSYGLKLQEKSLFDGTTAEKLKVGANGTSRVSLPFSFRYEDVLGSVTALREAKELRYQLRGNVDFGLFKLPYSKEGKFSLPTLPDISVQNLQVSKLDLSGVQLALKLKVDNLNGFPIRLDGVNYDLKLAGAALLQGQSTQPLAVGAHSGGVLNLKMSMSYGQVGSLLDKLRSAKSLPIEFNSRVTLAGAKEASTLPFQWKGDVKLVR